MIKKIVLRFLFLLRLISGSKYAQFLGVRIGIGCRILDDAARVFGSEPYLVKIGDNVEITNGVRFITHDGSVWVLRNVDDSYKNCDIISPIRVGNNVFIGMNTIILPGCEIGNNSIIGAGSVVTKNVPENSIVVGCPARVVNTIQEYADTIKTEKTKGLKYQEKKKVLEKIHPNWFN